MKREIKFRAWDGDDKEMYTPHVLGMGNNGYMPLRFCKDGNRAYKQFHPIMQYTGLKDKNGKEIYEGDIRQFKNGIGIIVWDDAAFAIKSPGSEAVDYEHSSVFIDSEYLGNIYENPELIKEEQ